MGNKQSSVRATHFQPSNEPAADALDGCDEHHINISNKMVERLVEDANIGGGKNEPMTSSPRGDLKEKIFIEKLKCLDKTHSERLGLTVEEIKALTNRIEIRTSNMLSSEPVCADCRATVIECYNSATEPTDIIKCWETVGAFTQCVQEEATQRLRARTEREDRERERRLRNVARAREHALKDLSMPYGDLP